MFRTALAIALLASAPALAQDILQPELDLNRPDDLAAQEAAELDRVAQAPGAVLRGLDKVSGHVVDMEMVSGEKLQFGRLELTLTECRYPVDNPAGDAFAFLEIRDHGETRPVFEGWMIASSPALNALDDARYDVWVLRCKTS